MRALRSLFPIQCVSVHLFSSLPAVVSAVLQFFHKNAVLFSLIPISCAHSQASHPFAYFCS
uniref:Secreted protein n=1 Tax=Ascaris lumbricoides TaxID=6252 RepID=A0A0M3IAG7_ASCLU